MAYQALNLGTAENDHTGDTARVGGAKINANFSELYATDASLLAAISAKPSLGETGSTAYRGDRGKTAYDFSQTATTVGAAFVALTNPGAITFIRVNADNSVSALSASAFRTAIGAGTSDFDGAYSSLTGAPSLAGYAPLSSPTFTGTVSVPVLELGGGAQIIGDAFQISLNNRALKFGVNNNPFIATGGAGQNTLILSDGFGQGVQIFNGFLVLNGNGGVIQLKSPDGTAYNITVANGGAVTSTAA